MSILNAFKRQLASALMRGSQALRQSSTGATTDSPVPVVVDGPLDDEELLVFDPAESAHAVFVDDILDQPTGFPNDRRLAARRNARPGTRVLLIDDSATIVALLRKLLRQNGYETLEAGDAETGIELARTEQPDLIFLDIVLPGMNGFSALRTLRRDPLTKAIPIVMISGNVAATEQFYVQRIGADDFMKKPFSRSEVFSRIEPLLDAQAVPRRSAQRGLALDEDVPAAEQSVTAA
ncbi:MAG: response regulator [Pseudomonadota bacterium]|nr:response regulator [Pseudomonadota bacterium]